MDRVEWTLNQIKRSDWYYKEVVPILQHSGDAKLKAISATAHFIGPSLLLCADRATHSLKEAEELFIRLFQLNQAEQLILTPSKRTDFWFKNKVRQSKDRLTKWGLIYSVRDGIRPGLLRITEEGAELISPLSDPKKILNITSEYLNRTHPIPKGKNKDQETSKESEAARYRNLVEGFNSLLDEKLREQFEKMSKNCKAYSLYVDNECDYYGRNLDQTRECNFNECPILKN